MAHVNPHYANLPGSYLFAEIARRVKQYTDSHPDHSLIRLGIGDVTQPLVPAVVDALQKAVREQADSATFMGYGPEQGYDFLRKRVQESCYDGLGIALDDIFISDGAKCDIGNFQELFSLDATVAITDPVYPVYADSNVMAGRSGAPDADGRFRGLVYLPCTRENGFLPALPKERVDIIYLCYPNNPTGTVLTRDQLAEWVRYAREHDSVIFFDAAYEAFIRSPDIPHSIYEIDGAREVAVEFRSYSKSAGFTGLRCGFAVVPPEVKGTGADGKPVRLRDMWNRRQTTKYNGCPYIVQRAAEAVHTPEGAAQCRQVIDIYLGNARRIRDAFLELGMTVAGGVDAPYVWLALPDGMDSWDFFDALLTRAEIVGTPGAGFGPSGQGYFRLTGFGNPAATDQAVERLKKFTL